MAMRKFSLAIGFLPTVIMILPLVACSSGAGRYSVDSRAMGSSWMIVGVLFGGFVVYSVIKTLFGKKDDDEG
jgi:hypothetical protein